MSHKYAAYEKLKKKRHIDLLFAKGKWTTGGALRVIALDLDKKPQDDTDVFGPKTGVSVSKKFFKKAVHRNRIKRLLREVYRLHKNTFAERFGNNSIAMIFWISKDLPKDYFAVEQEFLKLCKPKK